MPVTPRRRLLPATLLIAVAAALAACGPSASPAPASSAPAAPAGSPASSPEVTAVPGSPIASGPLVTYETRGGECPQGPCGVRVEIHPDGRLVSSEGGEDTLPPEAMARLAAAVTAADWDAILAVPFEGECPVNYDGQEEIYTFDVAPEPVVVASCTTLVDPAQEPFRTVRLILLGEGS